MRLLIFILLFGFAVNAQTQTFPDARQLTLSAWHDSGYAIQLPGGVYIVGESKLYKLYSNGERKVLPGHWRMVCQSASQLYVFNQDGQLFLYIEKLNVFRPILLVEQDLISYAGCAVDDGVLYLYGQTMVAVPLKQPSKQLLFLNTSTPIEQVWFGKKTVLVRLKFSEMQTQFSLLGKQNLKPVTDFGSQNRDSKLPFYSAREAAFFAYAYNMDFPNNIYYVKVPEADRRTIISFSTSNGRKGCVSNSGNLDNNSEEPYISKNEIAYALREDACGKYIEKFNLSGKNLGMVFVGGNPKDKLRIAGNSAFRVGKDNIVALNLDTGEQSMVRTSACCVLGRFGDLVMFGNSSNQYSFYSLIKQAFVLQGAVFTYDPKRTNIYTTTKTVVVESDGYVSAWRTN